MTLCRRGSLPTLPCCPSSSPSSSGRLTLRSLIGEPPRPPGGTGCTPPFSHLPPIPLPSTASGSLPAPVLWCPPNPRHTYTLISFNQTLSTTFEVFLSPWPTQTQPRVLQNSPTNTHTHTQTAKGSPDRSTHRHNHNNTIHGWRTGLCTATQAKHTHAAGSVCITSTNELIDVELMSGEQMFKGHISLTHS